jgi:hypothetical protein
MHICIAGQNLYEEAAARVHRDVRLRQEVRELEARRDAELLALQRG